MCVPGKSGQQLNSPSDPSPGACMMRGGCEVLPCTQIEEGAVDAGCVVTDAIPPCKHPGTSAVKAVLLTPEPLFLQPQLHLALKDQDMPSGHLNSRPINCKRACTKHQWCTPSLSADRQPAHTHTSLTLLLASHTCWQLDLCGDRLGR